MKRKNNLYENVYKFENILKCFNKVCRNTKNKNKVAHFKELKNKTYKVGKFSVFYIYDPKKRRIVSQNMYDKLVNHLVSRYILYPAISTLLD